MTSDETGDALMATTGADGVRFGKSEKRQRNSVVSVRMNDSEIQQLEALAREMRKPMATVLRERALSVQTPVTTRSAPPDHGIYNGGPTTGGLITLVIRNSGTSGSINV